MTTAELNRRTARGLAEQDLERAKEDVLLFDEAIAEAERHLLDTKAARASGTTRLGELNRQLAEAKEIADAAGTAAVGAVIANGPRTRELMQHAVQVREEVKWIEQARRQMIDRNMPLAKRQEAAAEVALAQAKVDALLAKSVMTKIATILSARAVWSQDPTAAVSTPAADRLWLEASVLADTDLRPAEQRLKNIDEQLAQAA